jgi:hypothetical protein
VVTFLEIYLSGQKNNFCDLIWGGASAQKWGYGGGVSDALFLGLLPLIGVRTKSGFSLGPLWGGGKNVKIRPQVCDNFCGKSVPNFDRKSVQKVIQNWGCKSGTSVHFSTFLWSTFWSNFCVHTCGGAKLLDFFLKKCYTLLFLPHFWTQGGCPWGVPLGGFRRPFSGVTTFNRGPDEKWFFIGGPFWGWGVEVPIC